MNTKNPTQLDEREVLLRLRNDDHQAFTQIYRCYIRKLLAIAYNYCRDKMLAEEIVQEVFIGLWERRRTVKINSIGAYLATAIKFSVFRTVHRQLKRKELAKNRLASSGSNLDDERIYALFLQEYINGMVEQLPERCRLVFKYSRQEGLSIPEISEKLRIAEKTVEAHLGKALKVLRTNLSREDLIMLVALGLVV